MHVERGHVARRHLDHLDEAVEAIGAVRVGEHTAARAHEHQLGGVGCSGGFHGCHACAVSRSTQLELAKLESVPPMIDLRRLQMFHAVATRRSFSAAALELSYTQSSVSEGVAVLERELGVTLLDRSSRPVAVTPAGEAILAHAEALLGQAAAIESDLVALSSGDSGVLRLAGFYTAW